MQGASNLKSYQSRDEFWDELVDSMDDWLKRGTMGILLSLYHRPMRYSELKNETGLPSGTLDRRLKRLIRMKLVRQKPRMTSSGRYRLFYELTDGVRETIAGIIMFVAESKKRYLSAINGISDLTENQKKLAKDEFLRRFRTITDVMARAFFEAVAIARARGR